jgi:predicted ATPase
MPRACWIRRRCSALARLVEAELLYQRGVLPQATYLFKHALTQEAAYAEAIAHLTQGLQLLTSLPDTRERAQQELVLQTTLGPALMATQGYATPEAERASARAFELCRRVGETAPLFPVLWGLFACYSVRAQLQTAHELGEQLLSLARRAQAHLEQGRAPYAPQQRRSHAFLYARDPGVVCLAYAAWALWLLGYPNQALQRSQEALTLAQELPHPQNLAFALFYAGVLHQSQREGWATQERVETVMTLARAQEFTLWVAGGTMLSGWASAEQGEGEEGVAQMRQGLAAWRATGAELGQPDYLALLAEALATARKTGERRWETELHRLKGELLLARSVEHDVEAATCFHQLLDVARRQQAKSLELRAVTSLSRLWQRQGKRDAARELLTEV